MISQVNNSLNVTDTIYHEVLEELLKAPIRGDRTGTGTHSIFGKQLRFTDIYKRFPLITTKKVFFRGVFHELKWMLMGDTNIKYLVDNGVSIWTDWPLKRYNIANHDFPLTKEDFENKIRMDGRDPGTNVAFSEKWGDCGPVYGYQWRSWEIGNYSENRGNIDQITGLLNDLKNNPESRRMIVSAWNVADIPAMIPSGLPPCHMFMQFYTRKLSIRERLDRSDLYEVNEQWVSDSSIPDKNKNKLDKEGIPERYLDCHVYIRSQDTMLGMPFNIAQYALLTSLIAKSVNMVPGDLVYTIGDCHLYLNHVEQAKEQVSRFSAGKEPTLFINKVHSDPKDYDWIDLQLDDYISHEAIKAPIAV